MRTKTVAEPLERSVEQHNSSIVSILCLPPISASLSYRLFAEEIADAPFLLWWTRQLIAMPGVKDVVIIARSDAESVRVKELLGNAPATVYQCEDPSTAWCLAACADDCRAPTVAIANLGLPFAPWRLLERAYLHHVEVGNEVTQVRGMPHGLAPTIFEARALKTLASLRVPGASTDPLELYQKILKLGVHTANDVGLSGVSTSFDAEAAYRASGAILPWALCVTDTESAETCRRVVERVGDINRDDTLVLETWRAEQWRERAGQAGTVVQKACSAIPRRNRHPRILYVSCPSATSGSEHSLLQMIGSMDHQRFDLCALVGTEGLFTARLRQRGVEVVCPNMNFSRGSVDAYLFASNLMRLLKPSIVHLNALSGSAVIAAATEQKIPIICHVRNRPNDEYMDALSYSSAVVAISEFVKTEIMQFGVPESRIHVIHNEVNAQEFCRQRFDRGTIRAALGLDDDVKMILMVARLTSYKRHDLMIEALPMIRAAVPSARVFALGEAFGEEEHVQGLRDKIKQSGQDEVFRLFPFQKDITQYYAAADAFVLCSDKEPLGRSIIEALAMETPVVVTDSGGPGEIIIDNETGMIARSGDARSLAKCLIRTLVDVPGCVTRTRAGRAFVEAHLSARSTAEKMMQIYELLMS